MLKRKTPLREVLKLGTVCRQRNHCCRFGSGFLVGEDLKNIAAFLKKDEKQVITEYLEEKELFNTKRLRPKLTSDKPYGECIFFNGKGCSIHEVKPLQCRVGNCSEHGEALSKWFMLNYLVNPKDPESIRQYASYLASGGKTIPGGKLNELVMDKEKLREILTFKKLK
jgi:Fe-S-cluster containining protein